MQEQQRRRREPENRLRKLALSTTTLNGLQRLVSSSNWSLPDEEPPELIICPVCGYEEAAIWDGWDRKWQYPVNETCPGCERIALGRQVLRDLREGLVRRYLSEREYAQMTFESYVPDPAYPSQAAAKQACLDLVAAWKAGHWERGILLASQSVGVGKTHLAIATAREGLWLYTPRDLTETILSVWDMPSYVEAVKDSYDEGGTAQIMDSAAAPGILVMDDLGAEYVATEGWYQGLMFNLFNARWKNRKATVVTTNLTLLELRSKLGARVSSRLLSLTGKPIVFEGRDYRSPRS